MKPFLPLATYRIQFHKDFKFRDLEQHLPYLAQLGIDTIYASPIFQARPGSTHGYDVTNANVLNPEIGTPEEFESLMGVVKKHGLKWLQDIVPNHMAFHESNAWLMDVFEKGPASNFYNFFDVNWQYEDPVYKGKLMAPFLGSTLEEAVANGEVKLTFSEAGFQVQFYENHYPVSLQTWPELLSLFQENGAEKGLKSQELKRLSESFQTFNSEEISEKDLGGWDKLKSETLAAIKADPELEKLLLNGIEKLNKNQEQLLQILNRQYFKLELWKVTDQQINYRRFFTINELICLRMEAPEVFAEYHKFILQQVKKDYFQGLRVDHVDGLLDPATYLQGLREAAGENTYLTVEKILELVEELPTDWPVQGTTGYFFLAIVNQLFTNTAAKGKFDEIYARQVPDVQDFKYEEMVFEKKIYMLENHMQGELDNLFSLMQELELVPGTVGFSEQHLKDALKILLAAFPVYRLYTNELPVVGQDAEVLEKAFARAEKFALLLKKELNYFHQLFQGEKSTLPGTPENRLRFLMRCQQFTGPLAAKGVEDTTFYNYNRLISHNEVGDNPEVFGISIERFHQEMVKRQQLWPYAQNATATHDTKRGEDARVRLNVLSEMPEEWSRLLDLWQNQNKDFLILKDNVQSPSKNRLFFLYQALIGAYPMAGEPEADFLDRVKEAMTKAVREAKMYSNWSEPNEAYEEGVHEFTQQLFAENSEFRKTFIPFVQQLNFYGMLYSLGQTLVKITAPGIPDIYQGCELWDLSMVDPDNRRPVNFDLRKRQLTRMQKQAGNDRKNLLKSLLENWTDASVKQFTVWQALQCRKANPELFTEGEYIPLNLNAESAGKVLGYARKHASGWCLVLVPLHVSQISKPSVFPLGEQAWSSSAVQLPAGAPATWHNYFTDETITGNSSLKLSEVFASLPVALLISENV
ncbi:malto-oligosyltrehalose synthase [Adhaeribacter soli]|uniref:Malto-oligosyltrehalose synthase n=1 Tax=Adhaeribacter soli TaxID=2607655 RepID=A0A5N1J605_9BACT|nr:malto-oligosyltrehalose synthase [Adhaeribacter soli]KAA9346144.1 malto-oligosyltrehalose synthase [Adhaeribacter soli]